MSLGHQEHTHRSVRAKVNEITAKNSHYEHTHRSARARVNGKSAKNQSWTSPSSNPIYHKATAVV